MSNTIFDIGIIFIMVVWVYVLLAAAVKHYIGDGD